LVRYEVTSEWKVGAAFSLVKNGKSSDTGTVLEYERPHRLSYSFHPEHDGLETRNHRVSPSISRRFNGQVKLTMTHDDFADASEVFPEDQCRLAGDPVVTEEPAGDWKRITAVFGAAITTRNRTAFPWPPPTRVSSMSRISARRPRSCGER